MTESRPAPTTTARRGVFLAVLLTVFLDLVGFGLVIPLLSFYAEQYGASPMEVTLLMATYSVAQFLFAPVWGSLSDRVGRRPVLLLSIAGSAIFLSLFAAADQLWLLFVTRALHGACAANISTAQAVIADITSKEDRAKGMGLIGAAFGVGFSLGPWLGGELSVYGLSAPIWAAAALSVVNLGVAWRLLPETRREDTQRTKRSLNPMLLLRHLGHPVVGMAILLTFVATFAFGMLESTFALVAEHSWAMDARAVGRMFALIGVVGIVIQGGLIGRLVKRFGEPRLVVGGVLINAAGLGLLAVVRQLPADTLPGPLFHGMLGVYLACVLVAVGRSVATPSLNALVSRGAEDDEQGTILGVNQSFAALARAGSPATGGWLYTAWYPGAAFAGGALLMLASAALAVPAARRAAADEAHGEL